MSFVKVVSKPYRSRGRRTYVRRLKIVNRGGEENLRASRKALMVWPSDTHRLMHGRHRSMLTMRWLGGLRLSTIACNQGPRPTARRSNGRKTMPRSQSALASIVMIVAFVSSGASADTFAYIGNADGNDISVFHVEPASGEI